MQNLTREEQIREIEKEFDAVIGYESIKADLVKIADVLKNSQYYTRIGAKIPQGVLISGEPGLGKTLMASCLVRASGRKSFVCRKDAMGEEFIDTVKKVFEDAKKALRPSYYSTILTSLPSRKRDVEMPMSS